MFSKKMVMIVGLIMLVTVSILMLSLSSRRPFLAYGPGRLAIALTAPFQKIFSSTSHAFRDIWEHYFYLITVAEQNERLTQELQQAKALNNQYREAFLSNQRLKQLLELKQEIQRPVIAAQVIGKDPSPWFQTIMVDKGSSDGVIKGLPVVNASGVVGLVVGATNHYAKVMLITDPNSAVDAVVQENRARGIIKGGTSGYCVFDYVLRKHTLKVGDKVITSGMDGVFPKGLPIGLVSEIFKQNAGIFQEVTLEPFVDFERLEEVVIIPSNQTADLP
jgi:rod shape-determining protein MreC